MINNYCSNIDSCLNFGSFFPHFVMNYSQNMDLIEDVSFNGKLITYAKSHEIKSYSETMFKKYKNYDLRTRKRLLRKRLLKHENCYKHSLKKIDNYNTVSTTINSSNYITSKLNTRRKLLEDQYPDSDLESDFSNI
mmetsp:Transcript_3201/g.2675  ORF Transcript_3201/g.2675 Transcript_3201/m.2675 type:complete len:136 (+) Transcript_3201:1050-1457(+)